VPQAAPAVGAKVSLAKETAAEYSLFGERGARAVVSVSEAQLAALRSVAEEYGVAASEIGQVTQDASLRIEYGGHVAVRAAVEALRDVWANSLERTLFKT
jgi:phosphoribosylformylglycinamidine (FGAM) synthase-like enzyme